MSKKLTYVNEYIKRISCLVLDENTALSVLYTTPADNQTQRLIIVFHAATFSKEL